MQRSAPKFKARIDSLLAQIYPEADQAELRQHIIEAFWPEGSSTRARARPAGNNLWDETDTIVITYGNTIVDGVHKPLDLLRHFLEENLSGAISGVHILPFFPFTSDDGFAVTDYRAVNSALGSWADISRIADEFKLMSDLVLNHVSSFSTWFQEYRQGHPPFDRFFFEASPEDDLSSVVRPRTSPLLREVDTAMGKKYVWCTFSHDQVDLDFSNPEVLLEFLRVIRLHVDHGVRIIRLDAVAFIWKEIGTNCIHRPQTHAIVRLIRLLFDYASERLVLLTETNVPNAENLSYFGNMNEAHSIYNFSLPPLILHALLNGTASELNRWQMAMPPAQMGCAYFNFTASHDGIGMRPVEGLLSEEETGALVESVRNFGGLVSMRSMPDGSQRPYELNITWYDAMQGTVEGPDEWQHERFLCSQTIVMALEGLPAFYIHALLGTPNDHDGVAKTGINRAINRHRWDYDALRAALSDPTSRQSRALSDMKARIGIRVKQKAFHPNATQFTLHLGDELFGFWRQSLDRAQSIFAIHNVTDREVTLPSVSINLIGGADWIDLISGDRIATSGGDITFAPYQCRWISNRA
ncbi:sugar phosphorylase [Tropicimonas sp. IMCC6043]|uniref:sugar phosphorylase n=1 Tax=Tropicimonas sp. IMCC6043 TaxID=2510645 RepID=UPI00101CAF84|nr:sugar phosphorylase [Tropicimonas sp. IMCC6043]RYH08440.1 alpha-amylase [Tropicimonas sp. IMCC6043]